MELDPLKIILQSKNWEAFVENLSIFENAPEYRKVKGDAFEYLTKFLLKSDPIFSPILKDVYHHSELPINDRDNLKLANPEVGVDLVAVCHDGSYYAIQCKFHQNPEQNVTYDELSTFFSITERENTYSKLSHRLVCTSANSISDSVRKLHSEKLGFLTRADFTSLDTQRFKEIHSLILGEKPIFKPFSPRVHQKKAVSLSKVFFEDMRQDRGKIIHPCGAGKSLTAYWIAKSLNSELVLIAVPSLALVKQTLSTWSRQAIADKLSIEYIAVCSDQDVRKSDDPLMNTHDLGISVTTQHSKVSKFLKTKSKNLRVLITTYQSGNVVINATKDNHVLFDLGVFDEAHKTAGDRTKRFAQLLDDNKLNVTRKLFMTATERQFIGDSEKLLSMDDESIYGKIIDQFSFKSALDQYPPILCDYKLITIGVTRQEIENIIINNSYTKANGKNYTFHEDGTSIAALVAHRKLTKDRGIKHAISFHKSIKRAKEFTGLYKQISPLNDGNQSISAFHVSGKMGTCARNTEIERFTSSSPSVISNARCLTEGIDIPVVDAVIFADPKQSVVDIVQAAGRAMRVHPKKKVGYIIIPVIIDPDNPDKINDSFKQLVNVVAALGISDERIIDETKQSIKKDSTITNNIMEFIEYEPNAEIEFEKFVKELKIKIWDRISFAKSVVGESEFNRWMKTETNLSDASMEKYQRAVRKISNDLVKLDLTYSSLEEIADKADLVPLRELYFSIPEYKDLDVRGNRMYSAGFNKLIAFQKFKKNQFNEHP
jgi:predicted helicase